MNNMSVLGQKLQHSAGQGKQVHKARAGGLSGRAFKKDAELVTPSALVAPLAESPVTASARMLCEC